MYGIMYPGMPGGFPYKAGSTLREAKKSLKEELAERGLVHLYRWDKKLNCWNLVQTFKDIEDVKSYRKDF